VNWKITIFHGQFTISMVIFDSYVSLPEGIYTHISLKRLLRHQTTRSRPSGPHWSHCSRAPDLRHDDFPMGFTATTKNSRWKILSERWKLHLIYYYHLVSVCMYIYIFGGLLLRQKHPMNKWNRMWWALFSNQVRLPVKSGACGVPVPSLHVCKFMEKDRLQL